MPQALIVAAFYIAGWLGYFGARASPSFEIDVALAVATSLAAGWAIGRWWALLLPIAVLPIFTSRLPYTPGGEPDFGVGMFYAVGFALITMVLLGVGVVSAKLTAD